MDLRDLRHFLAVAEERNFGRAADKLHMAQPPLSRSIKNLEAELGTSLFLRTSHGVELTSAGNALLADAPPILAATQRARERTIRAGQGLTGQLDIGLYGSAILDVVPRILARFHQSRPDVRVVLHNMSKPVQLQALRENKITVGFNRLVPAEDGLIVETVMREPYYVAIPQNHVLASRTLVHIQDLDDKPMILYPNSSSYGVIQKVIEAFRSEELSLRIEQEAEDLIMAMAFVASGFGLAVTTRSGASLQLPGVVFRPLESQYLRDIELSCIYRKDDTHPVLAAFLDALRTTEI
jgi:LysR family transcriptional regulator, benzoate and cis,cis-muconate-responsive activator of ben and cat genes